MLIQFNISYCYRIRRTMLCREFPGKLGNICGLFLIMMPRDQKCNRLVKFNKSLATSLTQGGQPKFIFKQIA